MSAYIKSLVIFLFLFILQAKNAWGVEFPVPEFFDISVVSNDMSYSGIAMSMSHFSSNEDVENIERFYKRAWPEYRVSRLDGLYVISYLDEDAGALFTVQVNGDWENQLRPEGFLSVSNIPEIIADSDAEMPPPGHGFPLHATATVVNDMSFNDGMRKSRFMYIAHDANARTVFDHYQSSLIRRGWVELNAKYSPREHFGVIRLQKSNKRLDVTLRFVNGKTQMTAVELN